MVGDGPGIAFFMKLDKTLSSSRANCRHQQQQLCEKIEKRASIQFCILRVTIFFHPIGAECPSALGTLFSSMDRSAIDPSQPCRNDQEQTPRHAPPRTRLATF